jgi:hypothetical protein
MADRAMGFNMALSLLILLMLAPIAIAAWRVGLFDRGTGEDEQADYRLGVPDESDSELIASDRAMREI